MKGIPIYDQFLSKIEGVGPAMAGIIISEIDIANTNYPAGLIKRAGLDVIGVGKYTDENNVEHIVPEYILLQWMGSDNYDEVTGVLKAYGKYPVTFYQEGRSRKKQALVPRTYTDREGDEQTRMSITFNPFLKTKLIGVLGSSFLRSAKTLVNGQRTTKEARLKMAMALGFEMCKEDPLTEADQVIEFLRSRDYSVEVIRSHYAKIYDAYKVRLNADPRHETKSKLHKHNMAIRYMIKQFLIDLYKEWRSIEDLPVMPSWAEAKLGLHGEASQMKQWYYEKTIGFNSRASAAVC